MQKQNVSQFNHTERLETATLTIWSILEYSDWRTSGTLQIEKELSILSQLGHSYLVILSQLGHSYPGYSVPVRP